ncbi:MMPL family transporter [Lapidilactobacillus bayanensis]|uniref:MMPL family transporter n=1 Tax=Lapidilactobacillus bayanensis TaxID=2485998 RepID=UPI000F771982|nr:MMPL family transporter [Lapidilactobacillus bayanensis]
MQKFFKNHYGALVAWLLAVVVAVVMLPNITQLVHDKGQTALPDNVQSKLAEIDQDDWGRGQGNTRQVVAIFNNGNDKLTATQKERIKQTLKDIRHNKKKYGIKSITAATDNAETKKQLISKDKSTQLVQFLVDKDHDNGSVTKMNNELIKAVKTPGVKTYVTGADILNNEFDLKTQRGLQKTEVIAAIFIFIVLILVFKSPIVPVISLLTVGVSLITSLSIVTNLVDKASFPFSNFTQVFMVVVLFGIGTDYNILLYDQFKEELSKGMSNWEATRAAQHKAGKTILYSGSSILIGFSVLGLAKFSIYRSTVGVAIGVVVLLAVLLTLNPFFMNLLGKKMFWPSKNFDGHSSSKMWHGLASRSVLHPLIALGVALLATLPFVLTYKNNLNYDNLQELGDDVAAKRGFEVVEKHFSEGTAEPTTLYIRSDHKLDNEADLKAIDQLTQALQGVDGVKTVASVTQPGGSKISKLYVKDQMGTVTDGMTAAGKGIKTINSGLTEAEQKLADSDMAGGLNDVQKLVNGTNQLVSGSQALQSGTSQLASGANSLNTGIGAYTDGVSQLNSGATQLSGNSSKITSGINQLVSQSSQLPLAIAGLDAYNTGINDGVTKINSSLASKQKDLAQLSEMSSKISGLKSKTNNMKQELSALSDIKDELPQMVSLLNTIKNNRSTLEQLMTVAKSMDSMKNQLTTVAKNDGAAYQTGVQTNAALEQSIKVIQNDSGASAQSQQAAATIAALVEKNKEATDKLGVNVTSLQALGKQLDGIDTSGLGNLQLPSDDQINSILAQLQNVSSMIDSANSLLTEADSLTEQAGKLNELSSAMTELTQGLTQLQSASSKAASVAAQLNSGVNGSGVNTSSESTIQSTIGNSKMLSQLNQLSSGMTQYVNGVNQLASGAGQLNGNSSALKSGASQLASGTSQLNGQVPTLTNGLTQVRDGQKTMYTTLQSTVEQMATLQSGLGQASDGLTTINSGVKSANSYLGGLKKSAAGESFYIPKSAIHGKDFKQSITNYMSEDKKITKLTIVLDQNPSSTKAMDKVRQLTTQSKNNIKGTALNDAKIAMGGQTSSTADTQKIASSDFSRTALIMVVGIGLALTFVTRSLLQPLFIIGTLLLSYFSSLSLTRWISATFLGHSQLTWNTPFFTFIMIFALGVDYSIFLMMKYRELNGEIPNPSKRIVEASGVIGAVVISAAVILSGTFAALMPSGVLTLIQVALGVIIGLVILVIILPVILPASIHLTYDHQKKDKSNRDQDEPKHSSKPTDDQQA